MEFDNKETQKTKSESSILEKFINSVPALIISYIVVFSFFAFVILRNRITMYLIVVGISILVSVIMIASSSMDKTAYPIIFLSLLIAATVIALAIAGISFVVETLASPSPPVDADGIDGWDKCFTCDGVGKVRNKNYIIVTCPACGGFKYIPE